jgi:hypothetical protein
VRTNHHDKNHSKERVQQLEKKAAVARDRLLHAVEALDARRREVVRMGTHAKELAVPAALSVLAVIALAGVSAFMFAQALKERRRRSLGFRARNAMEGFREPRRPSLARMLLERTLLTLMGVAVSQLGKRALRPRPADQGTR